MIIHGLHFKKITSHLCDSACGKSYDVLRQMVILSGGRRRGYRKDRPCRVSLLLGSTTCRPSVGCEISLIHRPADATFQLTRIDY